VKFLGLWVVAGLMLCSVAAGVFAAGRELHWDALDVESRLDASGVLDVIERHSMVFTGDWNGGERIFNLRPSQKLEFIGLERVDASGARVPLRQVSSPNDVDEFSWSDARTLRWRSRLPSDPPFSNTPLIYVLHYRLSGILLKDGEGYRLDHDFAFPKRSGSIEHFSLTLAFDSAWQPLAEVRERYDVGPIAPGRSFVLTIPLRFSGSVAPDAIDIRAAKAVVAAAAAALFAGFILIVLGFVRREQSLGRFDVLDTNTIDRAWIEQHILANPAEVVGMAWDGRIGTPEVVALIARMTAEGKLESTVEGTYVMRLRLKVERNSLDGHERALVDGLFFNGSTETSTTAIKDHYKNSGFNPAQIIKRELSRKVKTVMPPGDVRSSHLASIALFLVTVVLFGWSVYLAPMTAGVAVIAVFLMAILIAILQIPGWVFRTRVDWELRTAFVLMIPAFLICLGTALFLWLVVGSGSLKVPLPMIGAFAAWALCIASTSINGMKSRQSAAAIAFRKRLAAGRTFFMTELSKAKPDLQDNWYPWVLAFGLGKQVDAWSTHHASAASSSTGSFITFSNSQSSSGSTSSSHTWTGGGGLSGGAGATGAWTVAAAGMAAGVSDASSSSAGSSSGGSSGGGGGGGW
jgi:uncharacterized membrane protein YgcG